MTLTQFGVALATFAALGAAIKAGPSVWAFVRTIAAIPRMIESIWSEFGRNGGSTTRDRIEHIAREVTTTVDLAHRSDALLSMHTAQDSVMFQLIADRLGSIESAVVRAGEQEETHASERKPEYDQHTRPA